MKFPGWLVLMSLAALAACGGTGADGDEPVEPAAPDAAAGQPAAGDDTAADPAGEVAADSAGDAAADPAGDAPGADTSATERALERLSEAYEDLTGLVDDGSGEAMEWAQEDVEDLGDWEYRIVELSDDTPAALEEALNALGNERWEVYWVESTPDGRRLFLKRPAISYLSRVPLSALLRMLAGGGQ